MRWPSYLLAIFACLSLLACNPSASGQHDALIILAPTSTEALMNSLANDWQAAGHPRPHFSFAATSANARQLQAGATADIFLSADREWIQTLAKDKLVNGNEPPFAGGRLVLVAPISDKRTFQPWQIAQFLGPQGKIALADVRAVPLGRYSRSALASLGLWQSLLSHVVETDNAKNTLHLAESAEVSAAVVYQSDARQSRKVRILALLPESSHPTVRYYAADIINAPHRNEALAFLTFLKSTQSARRLKEFGFQAVIE